ncbi:hypothetical protein [Nonlabens ponticola]|uniref:Uncharacterized protein n=1 Tax=Nonlabens ponticola TaxID=2496866 RepID=A0A3S9MXV0_9FLAO|nr:hypothetical protein [Nonlabens ponticola]AZQ43873.1 hypothetical protein EJ995_06380 [Nonlabens ponticola]
MSDVSILSTVINFELYKKTSPLHPTAINRFVIDGRNGMHGLSSLRYAIRKLKSQKVDWLLMCDEDVIFQDASAIEKIKNHMLANDQVVAGVRDGGMISHRGYNPYVPNTFLCLIHWSRVMESFSMKEMLQQQFIKEAEFADKLHQLPFKFDRKSVFEPYYRFFFYLRRKGFKMLFLDSQMATDGISNHISWDDKIMATHTWYARSYGVNEKHTKRINGILKDATFNNLPIDNSEVILWKDPTYFLTSKVKKIARRIHNRFSN